MSSDFGSAHPNRDQPDLDSLIGSWWAAFEAARAALDAGSRDLGTSEVGRHRRGLAEERVETVRLLDALARDRNAKRMLVRLVAAPWEAKRLLGLPRDVGACVFNVDGVLVASAEIHAEAWRETFDEFVFHLMDRTSFPIAPFSVDVDYPRYIHGFSRVEGVRGFLASRGISLPDGSPVDPPGEETVHGLANRKNEALRNLLDESGVSAFQGSRLYLQLAHDASVPCAVVSGSTNVQALLDRAQLSALIDARVDGNTMRDEGLHRKPAPDMLVAACRHLGAEPEQTAVFETTPDGVAAGRAGRFKLVVAVDRGGEATVLRAQGADLVVADLGEILERALAA